MEYKTNHSLGTIHQQNGCEWSGNNMEMVTPLIIEYLRVSRKPSRRAHKGFLQEWKETFILTHYLGQKLMGVWANLEEHSKNMTLSFWREW